MNTSTMSKVDKSIVIDYQGIFIAGQQLSPYFGRHYSYLADLIFDQDFALVLLLINTNISGVKISLSPKMC
jgi:hypothetical protein